jgi:hypothetical protein
MECRKRFPHVAMHSQPTEFTGRQAATLAERLGDLCAMLQLFQRHQGGGAAHIARALSAAGFGVLRFGFTGLRGSGTNFSNTPTPGPAPATCLPRHWAPARS